MLCVSDIKEYFDCDYHRFVQGATFHKGKIYSLEGFAEHGLSVEPELIDFYDGVCYYGDNHGNLYIINFLA